MLEELVAVVLAVAIRIWPTAGLVRVTVVEGFRRSRLCQHGESLEGRDHGRQVRLRVGGRGWSRCRLWRRRWGRCRRRNGTVAVGCRWFGRFGRRLLASSWTGSSVGDADSDVDTSVDGSSSIARRVTPPRSAAINTLRIPPPTRARRVFHQGALVGSGRHSSGPSPDWSLRQLALEPHGVGSVDWGAAAVRRSGDIVPDGPGSGCDSGGVPLSIGCLPPPRPLTWINLRGRRRRFVVGVGFGRVPPPVGRLPPAFALGCVRHAVSCRSRDPAPLAKVARLDRGSSRGSEALWAIPICFDVAFDLRDTLV